LFVGQLGELKEGPGEGYGGRFVAGRVLGMVLGTEGRVETYPAARTVRRWLTSSASSIMPDAMMAERISEYMSDKAM